MRVLLTGDLHLTNKKPKERIDDYPNSVLSKFKFILDTAYNENCRFILCPGDFFNSPSLSFPFFYEISNLINLSPCSIISTFGQHDLEYRNLSDTALWALHKREITFWCVGRKIPLLSVSPFISPLEIGKEKIKISASGFDEEIPEPAPNLFNILLIHKMIVDDKVWATQEGHEYGMHFLRRHKFDLIVSGDNHQSFTIEMGDRHLINNGSMMRSAIDQIDHKPRITIFDTMDRSSKTIMIPIKPSKEVFNIEEYHLKKEKDASLVSFVKGLSQGGKRPGLKFEANLAQYNRENKIDAGVVTIMEGWKK